MYRVSLTEVQRQALHRRIRQPTLPPRTRERLEMVRLSDARWSVPQIAGHLQQHEQTVRRWIKAFLNDGFDANPIPDRSRPLPKTSSPRCAPG